MIKDTQAYRYAKWCVRKNNKKAPHYVKKQAKAWLDVIAGKNKAAYFARSFLYNTSIGNSREGG